MKLLHALTIAVACAFPLVAAAQWQWLDKDGRKVFSDRAPPADIPASKILKQPGGLPAPAAAAAAPSASTPVATAAKMAASAPRISGKDKALEDKKKQAEAQEAARAKAEEDKLAADKAKACEGARRNLLALNSGERIRRPNAKGEMEFLDDASRATELKRVQGNVSDACSKS